MLETFQQLVNELRKEAEGFDDEQIKQAVNDLDTDIHQLLLAESELPEKELAEEIIVQAKAMEAKFAVKYPVAERLIQEIIYILGRIGI